MDLGLKDKVVIVTGGAKGIGAAIVRATEISKPFKPAGGSTKTSRNGQLAEVARVKVFGGSSF